MIEYAKVTGTIIVDCGALGAGPFSVLVVPMESEHIENNRNFYLLHKTCGIVQYMFGCAAENDEAAAELAFFNAGDYIPDYLKEYFENE